MDHKTYQDLFFGAIIAWERLKWIIQFKGSEESILLMGLFPGGGGQGLVGVPIFGGSAGGTSSFLTDVSSSIFL